MDPVTLAAIGSRVLSMIKGSTKHMSYAEALPIAQQFEIVIDGAVRSKWGDAALTDVRVVNAVKAVFLPLMEKQWGLGTPLNRDIAAQVGAASSHSAISQWFGLWVMVNVDASSQNEAKNFFDTVASRVLLDPVAGVLGGGNAVLGTLNDVFPGVGSFLRSYGWYIAGAVGVLGGLWFLFSRGR